jgi:BirA family biotin operon repressor/biotin-[acetyl-CoA-carboxylase] ligase
VAAPVPLATWEGRALQEWERRWRIPSLTVYATTSSTNDDARALALRGSPAGTVVIAEHQSAGRGREGRSWEAEPGKGLLFSVILRYMAEAEAELATPTPLRVGLAVAAALEGSGALSARLKWPNDVIAPDGRKLAGILCEAAQGAGEAFVVAGVGINILQREWPPSLGATATSILESAGRAPARPVLLEAVLDRLRPFAVGPPQLDESELRAYRLRDALHGRLIDVDGIRAGRADGIECDGALRVRSSAGARLIRSGTVRLAVDSPPQRAAAASPRAPDNP